MNASSAVLLALRFIRVAFMQVEQKDASFSALQCSQDFQSSFFNQSRLNRFCFFPIAGGNHISDQFAEKVWPTGAGFVLSVTTHLKF